MQAALFNNVVEELTILHILHYDIDVHRRLDDLKEANYVWMVEQRCNFDLPLYYNTIRSLRSRMSFDLFQRSQELLQHTER